MKTQSDHSDQCALFEA